MKKILLVGISLAIPNMAISASHNHPNVVIIMADDMGWGDVGFNGNVVIKTPNLDSLSKEGIVLERFYSAAPLSSPTRASVLTGRHPFRTGVFSANVGILRQSESTIAELLKNRGYATGLFGKWHLGTLTYNENDANRGQPENKHLYNPPSWHGFDEYFVTESKVPTYDPMIQPIKNDGRFWDYIQDGDSYRPYGTSYWEKGEVKVSKDLRGDDSRIIVDRALNFMTKSIEKNIPFLSVIWFHAPHLPCVAGPQYVSLYKNLPKDQRNYYGCITALDNQIGRVVQYLKVNKVFDNSIILFCSDNGPELETPGSPGNFLGKKRSLHEGGIRVPSIMCYPAKISRGIKFDIPCSTLDYMPTVLDILKVPTHGQLVLDGESLWPLIKHKSLCRKRPLVFCSDKQGAVIDGDYKLYYSKGKSELYQIVKDPEEKKDLSLVNQKKTNELLQYLKMKTEDYRLSFESGKNENHAYWQDWWDIWK